MNSNNVLRPVFAGADNEHQPNLELTKSPPVPGDDAGELSKQIVDIIAVLPEVTGARLYSEKTEPRFSQQSGTIPPADSPAESKKTWTRPLRRNEELLGVLEIYAREPLTITTQALLSPICT